MTADPESEVRRDRLEPEVLLDGFKVEMPAPSAAAWVDYMATAYGPPLWRSRPPGPLSSAPGASPTSGTFSSSSSNPRSRPEDATSARGDLEKSAFQALIARTADPASLHLALGSRS